MSRVVLHGSAAIFFLAPIAFPCSIPQPDTGPPAPDQSVAELLDANHFRRAEAKLSADKSGSPQHDYLLSRIQLGFRQYDPAMELAEKAVSAEPNNAAYHLQVATVVGRMAEHASMFKQLGLAKRIHRELEESIALDPNNADAIYGLMLFAEVAPSFLGGDKVRAQQLAERLTDLDPPRGLVAQASLAHDRHDSAVEETLLKKAVSASPQSYEARIALATFYLKAGATRSDEADEEACEALYLDPTRTEAWQLLAEMAGLSGCLPEVDGLVSTQQKFNPDDVSSAYAGALGMVESGKNLEAAKALLDIYLAKPQEGNSPSAGLALYRLANLREKEGRTEEAVALLHSALADDPSIEDAKKDLKRLDHPVRTP